jgi:hypothetical protein
VQHAARLWQRGRRLTEVYSQNALNARLQAVATTIDSAPGNGSLILLAGASPASVISLAKSPCAVASGGVLTFQGVLLDPSAIGGHVTGAIIQDSLGNTVVSGLTASSVPGNADIILSNTTISAGAVVQILSATIKGT